MKGQRKPIKLHLHPVYPWKCDLKPHPDKKRQRKAKTLDKAIRQARKIKEVSP